jgi:hypothetical protein
VLLRKLGGLELRRYFAHYPRLLAATLGMVAGVAGVQRAVSGAPSLLALAAEIAAGTILMVVALQVVAPQLMGEVKQTARTLRPASHT